MNTNTGKAERFGRGLGRMWRGYMRRERRVASWLIGQGLPAKAAIALLWIVKLGVFGALLYAAFWLALLLLFAVIAAWIARNADWDEETPLTEWRYGSAGYGLYTSDGYRIDPHDPEDEK